jgi:hypothetical protein
MSDFTFDASEFIVRLLKYFLEGAAVATAAYLVPSKKLAWDEVVILGLTAACIFSLLDFFAPSIGATARQGAGLAIGSTVAGGLGVNRMM